MGLGIKVGFWDYLDSEISFVSSDAFGSECKCLCGRSEGIVLLDFEIYVIYIFK